LSATLTRPARSASAFSQLHRSAGKIRAPGWRLLRLRDRTAPDADIEPDNWAIVNDKLYLNNGFLA
jgi:hypothetical protein